MLAIPRRVIHIYKGEFRDIVKAFWLRKVQFGDSVRDFEGTFAKFIGINNFFALSSGRASLRIILEVLEIVKGSEVILPAYTAEEVPATLIDMGLTPVFVDIKETDHNIDPRLIEKKITSRTRGIIATHLFGVPCDMDAITQLSHQHGLFVIEDCAHAIGAAYKDRPVGSLGQASFFSFANSKPFNALGGGGIATNDSLLAEKIAEKITDMASLPFISLLKSIFITALLYFLTYPLVFSILIFPFLIFDDVFIKKDDFAIKGYAKVFKRSLKSVRQVARMSNVQAFIGLKQINQYKKYCTETKKKMDVIKSNLGGMKYLTSDCPEAKAVPYFFVISIKHRRKLSSHLLRRGIDSGHSLMRYCPAIFNDNDQYPMALSAFKESLQIPMHRFVNDKILIKMAGILNDDRWKNE